MYNMRWRARLRRMRLPIPAAGWILANKINRAITDVTGFGPFKDLLKWPADKLGELIDDKVSSVIGGVTSSTIAH